VLIPSTDEPQDLLLAIKARVRAAMYRAGLVAGNGFTLLVDSDTEVVNGDITAKH
jgi:hypothetical protein